MLNKLIFIKYVVTYDMFLGQQIFNETFLKLHYRLIYCEWFILLFL